jgi:hypothetical protein
MESCDETVITLRTGTRVFPTAHLIGWRIGSCAWRAGWRGFQTAHSIPEGLHVYSQSVSREHTTPGGVEQLSATHYLYNYSIPAWSAYRPLESGRQKMKE